jgi:hypothetical protein
MRSSTGAREMRGRTSFANHVRRGSMIAAYPPMPVRAHPGAVHESCGNARKTGKSGGDGRYRPPGPLLPAEADAARALLGPKPKLHDSNTLCP